MSILVEQVFRILTTPPGNLIYHLAVALTLLAGLQAVLAFGHRSPTRRMVLGFAVLLAAQVLLFAGSALVWQNLLPGRTLLPPLDRAVLVLSLLWLAWMWAFPARSSVAEAALIFLNLLAAIFFAFTLSFWADQSASLAFSQTWFASAWNLFALGIVLIAILLLLIRRPVAWAAGLALFGLLTVGLVYTLVTVAPAEDYSGPLRLAFLAALPAVLSLPQRALIAPDAPSTARTGFAEVFDVVDRGSSAVSLPLLSTFLDAASAAPEDQRRALARFGAVLVHGEVCAWVVRGGSGQLILADGYDLTREQALESAHLPAGQAPRLAAAAEAEISLQLAAADRPAPELSQISQALGIAGVPSLLYQPVGHNPTEAAGLLALSPYSGRFWSEEEETLFAAFAGRVAALLQPPDGLNREMEALEQALTEAETTAGQQRHTLQEQAAQIDQLRSQNQQLASQAKDLTALAAVQTEHQETIAHLQRKIEELRQVEDAHHQATLELHEARTRLQALEAELAGALAPTRDGKAAQLAEAAIFAHDMRQPLGSINGYAELLLGESLGPVGPLQRKFLDRILAAGERLRYLTDEIERVLAQPRPSAPPPSELVPLASAVDDALEQASGALLEKRVTVEIDVPETLPALQVDRDAIQQVLAQLLLNAAQVSPEGSVVLLRARLEDAEGSAPSVLIEVTDSGPGIAAADREQVFSVGGADPAVTGVGLAGPVLQAIRSLVEAGGGRLTITSPEGAPATFAARFPVGAPAPAARGGSR